MEQMEMTEQLVRPEPRAHRESKEKLVTKEFKV